MAAKLKRDQWIQKIIRFLPAVLNHTPENAGK
jgi:hypothetical protein